MSLDEQRLQLEHALTAGEVRIIGERGVRSASPEFLMRLDELPPSARRFALARACAHPWRHHLDELPDCYRWELRKALDEWREDRAAYPDAEAALSAILEDVPEPISKVVLSQIVELTPTSRYSSLVLALAGAWPGGPKPLLTASPDAPRWLARELAYTGWASSDEFRRWKDAGWVSNNAGRGSSGAAPSAP